MTTTGDVETVERFIAAPPEKIFALLTDPSRHRDFDGSGTVCAAKGAPGRLVLGSRFGMSMRMKMRYSMESTVIEYVENRRLAWQTRGPGTVGRTVGGRVWRYELEPSDGGTLVRETWDVSRESILTRRFARNAAAVTRKNMAATLARIETIVA